MSLPMKNLIPNQIGRRRLTIIIGSIVAFAAILVIVFYEGTKHRVFLKLDGEKRVVRTHADTITAILQELEITAKAEDYLSPSGNSKVKDRLEVVWEPARQVKVIQDGGSASTVWTTSGTVEQLLIEQKLALSKFDKIRPSHKTKIHDKMTIAINHAFPVSLVVGGKEKQVWSTSATVADFLKQQGIKIHKLDRVKPNLSDKIHASTSVNVIRVQKVTDVVEEPIKYSVLHKKDNRLLEGKSNIVEPGKDGLLTKQYEVIREDGKEVARKLISEKVIKQKKDRVVAVGAKNYIAQASRGERAAGGQMIYVNSTAYTASCHGCSGRTATGINLRANPNVRIIAVDPRVIPLGSKVYVEGYGYAVAADTGGAIKGHKIDVYFPNTADAYRWGSKKVRIRIFK
ncbi:ubiquitin-like domain-containing protein [Peribacillus sp. SCS-155]|uniref:ubiquitin-like domain-containing protein n=1 Tax=Peribacillus sedimenti TaxID=3115297 RepID=UPI0039058589